MENMDEEIEEIYEEDILQVIDLDENEQPHGNETHEDDGIVMDNIEEMEEAENANVLVDNSVLTFTKHKGEVFSIDLGSNEIVATGGEDDLAYVWNSKSGDVIFQCKDHADSVTCLKFNSKKTLLATGDMSGIVQIWNVDNFQKVQQFHIGDLEWLCWHHTADILFSGDSDGVVWMWLINTDNCKVYAGHGASCTSGVLFSDGKRLCAGYKDGVVKLWNLKEADFVTVTGSSCHTESVTCVDCHSDNNIAASGSEDGTVNLFHASNGRIIETIVCAKRDQNITEDEEGEAEGKTVSVESVAFSSTSSNLLAIGTVLGDLILWDINASQIRQQMKHPDGIVKASWFQHLVVTACLDGVLRAWDSRSGSRTNEWKGHGKEILDFAITKNGESVITASADQSCKIFPLNIVDSSR